MIDKTVHMGLLGLLRTAAYRSNNCAPLPPSNDPWVRSLRNGITSKASMISFGAQKYSLDLGQSWD